MFASTTPLRRQLGRGFVCALAAVLVTSGCAAGRDAQTQNQVPTQDGNNANVGSMALRGIALESPSSVRGYAAGSAIPMRLVLVNNGTSDDKLTNIVTSVARGWAGYPNATQASQATSQQTASTTPGSSGPSASNTPGTSASTPASRPTRKPGKRRQGTTTSASSSPAAIPSVSPSTSAPVPAAETAITVPAGQRVSYGVPDSQRVLLLLSSLGRVYPGSTVKITFTFSKAGSVSVQVPVQTTGGAG